MVKKANEKNKRKYTKEKRSLDLDNEIIIGIKTLPEPKSSKKKSTKKVTNKKNTTNKKKSKIDTNVRNRKYIDEYEPIPSAYPKKAKQKSTVNARRKKSNVQNKKVKRKEVQEEEIAINLGIEEPIDKKASRKRKNYKTTKEQELAKKRRLTIFRVVKWTALSSILLGGGICFLLSPFFNVTEIKVIGNERIDSNEIISLSGIQLEENTFKIEGYKAQQNIKENTYIDTVTVKRKLPNKIEIKVEERKPTFMLAFANAYIYINNQGYLLEVSNTALDVPIITGFLTKEEELHPGNRLCSEDLQRLEQTLQIIKSAEINGIGNLITKINIEDKQNYILELKSEKKSIHIGDSSNLSTKMLYIISILDENKGIEGEIFVNTDLNNKGAIFRKKI